MKRRAFLQGTSKLSLAMAIPYSISKRGFAAMLPSDITSLSAVDLSQVIREKHASCVEVMQAYLSRIEKYNSVYNAIVSLQPEQGKRLFCVSCFELVSVFIHLWRLRLHVSVSVEAEGYAILNGCQDNELQSAF